MHILYVFMFYKVCNFFIWFILGSYIIATAEKLNSELLAALDKLCCIRELKQKAKKELRYVAKTYQ